MTIAIGECRFDTLRREVRRGSQRVHLSPKAFELLGLLLDRRPRAVSKDELFALLWPTTFVTDASLAVLVAENAARTGLGLPEDDTGAYGRRR